MYRPQILKQRDVTLKLAQRCQNIVDARAVGYILRKAAKKERNQPRNQKFVAVNKDEKGVGDLKIALTLEIEM